VADYLAANDPDHGRWLAGINRYGEQACGWDF